MSQTFLITALLLTSALAFMLGRRRAVARAANSPAKLHSRPTYYGALVALWCLLPAAILLIAWSLFDSSVRDGLLIQELGEDYIAARGGHVELVLEEVRQASQSGEYEPELRDAVSRYQRLQTTSDQIVTAILVLLCSLGIVLSLRRIQPRLRARNEVETIVRWVLAACSLIAIVTTVGIVLSVLFEAIRFFRYVPITEFLFGTTWSPQTAIRSDQVGSSGAFGAVPLFTGTFLISAIALAVAVPVGLLAAIYLAEYASSRVRSVAKPLLEVLAGIPTVVYGFFAALTVAPLIRDLGTSVGLDVSSESALAAGLVMGIMIIPFVSSLSDDVINAVPESLRNGSMALGATRSETILKVVMPAALPGVVGSILLAASRAIGETMIVVMAAGLAARLTANPLESVTTVTVQIVTLLVGDQEFDSPKTLAAFALGLVLFVMTLVLNVIALYVVRRYREQYD